MFYIFIPSHLKFLSLCTKSLAYVLCSLEWLPKYLFDSQNREADLLIQGQQTFFCKGQDSKYFRFCRTSVGRIRSGAVDG